jgi:hypothetical protein
MLSYALVDHLSAASQIFPILIYEFVGIMNKEIYIFRYICIHGYAYQRDFSYDDHDNVQLSIFYKNKYTQ